MGRSAKRWQQVGVLAVGMCLLSASGRAQFTSFNDRSRLLLEGNWQSCREGDGQYAERVYDGKWPGLAPFELHLGPYHEFALFQGVQEEHRDHRSTANLLRPHTVELVGNRGTHKWDVDGLHFEVSLAGGSREECESWYVRLTPATSSSH